MPDIDTSIYRQPQSNPIQNFSNTVGMANAIEQNRLLKGQQVQQQIGIDTSKLALAQQQLGAFRSLLAPLINNPNLSRKDIDDIGIKAVQQKLATPQQVVNELTNLPRNASPQELARFVQNLYVQSLGHSEQIGMMLGPVQGVGTGGGTTFVQQPGMPGRPARQVGQIPNTLPPGTQVYNPDTRQPEYISQGQPGTFQPQRPVSPGAGLPPPNVSVGGAAPLKGKPQDRVPAGAPMGVATAAEAAAGPSGTLLATDRANAADFTRQVFPLEQAIPKLETLGKTGTGPSAEETNHIKSFLQTLGIPGFDPNKIKNFDEANKYLTDWVMANGNVATNDKLAASFASNASTKISNAAAIDVAKAALAIRRMKQAQLVAFEETGKPESEYSKWASQWNQKQDPRVYGFDMMTPKQRTAFLSGLPKNKRALIEFDIQAAERAGLIKTPAPKAPSQKPAAGNPNGA